MLARSELRPLSASARLTRAGLFALGVTLAASASACAPKLRQARASESVQHATSGAVESLGIAPLWELFGHDPDVAFGSYLAVARDRDGDGRADVYVCAPRLANGPGDPPEQIYVVSGATGGRLLRIEEPLLSTVERDDVRFGGYVEELPATAPGAPPRVLVGSGQLLNLGEVGGLWLVERDSAVAPLVVLSSHEGAGAVGGSVGALAAESCAGGFLCATSFSCWNVHKLYLVDQRGALLEVDAPEHLERVGTLLAPVGDIDGDGCNDIVASAVSRREGDRRVVGFSTRTRTVLFELRDERAGAPLVGGAELRPLPDLDDDGCADLAWCFGYRDAAGALRGRCVVASGRSGASLGRIEVEDLGAGFGAVAAGRSHAGSETIVCIGCFGGDGGPGRVLVHDARSGRRLSVVTRTDASPSFGEGLMLVAQDSGEWRLFVGDPGALDATSAAVGCVSSFSLRR